MLFRSKKEKKRSPYIEKNRKKMEKEINRLEEELKKIEEMMFLEENYLYYKKMEELELRKKEVNNTLEEKLISLEEFDEK